MVSGRLDIMPLTVTLCFKASGYDQIDWLPLKLSQNIKMIVSMRDSDPRNTLSKVQSRYTDPQTFLEVSDKLIHTYILTYILTDFSDNLNSYFVKLLVAACKAVLSHLISMETK